VTDQVQQDQERRGEGAELKAFASSAIGYAAANRNSLPRTLATRRPQRTRRRTGAIRPLRQFHPAVFGMAMRVTGDRHMAEDSAQEVFVGFWRRPECFKPDRGSMRTWLATVARNRAIDALRVEEARRRRTDREARRRIDAQVAKDRTSGPEGATGLHRVVARVA